MGMYGTALQPTQPSFHKTFFSQVMNKIVKTNEPTLSLTKKHPIPFLVTFDPILD